MGSIGRNPLDNSYDVLQAVGQEGYNAFDVVVIAASAGGISALISFLSGLPACFPAPIIIAQHLSPQKVYKSCLDRVLGRSALLTVKWAADGEMPRPGSVYLAPQDRVTVIDPQDGTLRTNRRLGLLRSTPAANPLFESAAQCYGARTLALVLSGALRDGAEGALAVARAGGRVLVQSYHSADFADMPRAAMEESRVGLAFDPCALAHVVVTLVMAPGASDWFQVGNRKD